MTVTLTSADGNLRMGPPTRVTVASAVFSGAGAALTVGALLFLALWWGNHFRRTRRRAGAPRPRRERRGRRAVTVVRGATRPLELGRRPRHAAVTRHRARRASRVLAYALGQATLADTYNLANTTPNIVYELLIGGVLSATLVPVFVDHLQRRDDRGDVGRVHRHDDRARRADRDRDGVRAADRPPLLARRRPAPSAPPSSR